MAGIVLNFENEKKCSKYVKLVSVHKQLVQSALELITLLELIMLPINHNKRHKK